MLDLEPIKARASCATEEPWCSYFGVEDGPGVGIYVDEDQHQLKTVAYGLSDGDQNFITHARTDIPALIEETEKLRSLLCAVLTEQTCGEPDEIISPELERAIHNALQ